MICLQKSAKNHCKKYNILVHKKFFCFNGNYSIYALSINQKVQKLEHSTPI